MVWSLSTQSTPDMNSLFSRASLNRSSRTRTRKNTISVTTSNENFPPRSSSLLSRPKTRPPPLQIIPELSENEINIDVSPTNSPATARPMEFYSQQMQLDPSRITLSAYTFSIDDALLMFGEDTPRSPALSASSSTSGASSEDVPATPGFSDDEDVCDSILSIPRLRPQRVSIRPLQIIKTRSIICQDDEDIQQCFGKEEENAITLLSTEVQRESMAVTAVVEEVDQDFYAREFEDFITLSPVVPFHSPPARRDSLTLVVEALPVVIDIPESKRRGRSRHSKPLPLLPPTTPPLSTLPSMFPLVQTTAHSSVVRRKRNILPRPNSSSPLSLDETRPLPRMSVPLDVEDCIFLEDFDGLSRDSIVSEHPYRLSHAHVSAIPETPLANMYGDELLPRSSMDSDSSRSSIDSASSFTSSSTSNTPTSPTLPSIECPESEDARRLRSRWSSSTLASVVPDPPRTGTLLSPFRNILSSRVRRMPVPKVLPSKYSKSKQTTPSPPGTPSRLSTSSRGSSSSGGESRDGSPIGLHRKPIPMLMFHRST